MGWELRGNQRYYYRKRRIGKRVVSIYVGKGPLVKQLAELDEMFKEERALQRQVLREDLAQVALIQEVEHTLRLLTATLLITNGHYAHKRQWRKRRVKTDDHQEV